jgi:hypothetical protein
MTVRMFLAVSTAFGMAVKVTNHAKIRAHVKLYVSKLINVLGDRSQIEPGSTHPFDTGSLCPSWFTGYLNSSDFDSPIVYLRSTSILGHEISNIGFSARCWNSPLTICEKVKNSPLKSGDYGFCKE